MIKFTPAKPIRTLLLLLSITALAARPALASSGSEALQERYQAALNDLAIQVRACPDAAAKRARLETFITGMDKGLEKVLAEKALSPADRISLETIQRKYASYAAELRGEAGFDRVPDGGLDKFAAYILQATEQAPVGGGIYISSGVLIIILILIIILT